MTLDDVIKVFLEAKEHGIDGKTNIEVLTYINNINYKKDVLLSNNKLYIGEILDANYDNSGVKLYI